MEGSTQAYWQHRVPKRKTAELKEEEHARSKKNRLPGASESSIPNFPDVRLEPSIGPPSRRQRDGCGSEQANDASSLGKGGKLGMLEGDRGRCSGGKGAFRGGQRGSEEGSDCGNWPTTGRVNLTFRRVENNFSKK